MRPDGRVNSPTRQCVSVGGGRVARLFCQRGGTLEGLVGPCEAGVRTGGRKLEGSKREMDRNGSAYSALLVEYDGVLAFLPRVCFVF